MTVYIYDKKTNEKKNTFRDVFRIESGEKEFKICNDENAFYVDKNSIKLVVYGF